MQVDSVITLEDGINCLLLEKTEYNNDSYFMAVVLTEQDEPTKDYMIFKEVDLNNEKYIEKVKDTNLLTELLKLFNDSFNKKYSDSKI